jgi:uncharacterized protein (TIGR00730 family)
MYAPTRREQRRPGGRRKGDVLSKTRRGAAALRRTNGPRTAPDFVDWREPIVAGLREEERLFLGSVRNPREEERRVARIAREFMRGIRALDGVEPAVTVFGSARFRPRHPWYRLAVEMGRRLAGAGYTVVTGGGPGIMEAANRGARLARGRSIGLNIKLPHEQKPNPYVDRFVEFRYFFVRKVMLVKYSKAFVVLPGGFGTLDELFEVTTLIQTRKLRRFPVVLMGSSFWSQLRGFVKSALIGEGAVSRSELDFAYVTDSPEEAMDYIERAQDGPAAKRS